MTQNSVPFNKVLRKATRDVHSVSDALVNSKLAFSLSSNKVWAEGLLIFFEIFRFLEEAMLIHLKDTPVGAVYVEGIGRSQAFERDLTYYLGSNWKRDYSTRPAVVKYLNHLNKIKEENPNLLIAYIYHLYMGLLSGGQILRKKRNLLKKLKLRNKDNIEGESVTTFPDNSIYNLKCQLVANVNKIANDLSEEMRQQIIDESRTVFFLNNEIIRTIEGTKEVLWKQFLKVLCFLAILTGILIYIYSKPN